MGAALLLGCSANANPASAKVGAAAPGFTLTDLDGKAVQLSDFKGKTVVAKGKQGAGADTNRAATKTWNMTHPVLLNESGKVGKAYGATNTPHLYVIDPKGTLVYAGAIDNSPQGGTLINHVDAALDDLAAGRPVKTSQTRAYGCSVKFAS
ncbi:MAG: thioredoxin family protein [Myxococcota bacterium]|nr:thioredoxin family protein [Myxococcota bacterium]